MNIKRLVTALLLGSALHLPSYASDGFNIGVYYFPGWKDNQYGSAYPLPWENIKPYPEREPLLGWYPEGETSVMEKQLEWMNQYGIDYVVFDWFWGGGQVRLPHAINAYLAASNRHNVKFAVMWTVHSDYTFSLEEFKKVFHYWADRYAFRKEYLQLNGKPVVFIFSNNKLNKNAAKIGMTTLQLQNVADQIFKDAGLGGINFIGGVFGGNADTDHTLKSGFQGFSSYNLHQPVTFRFAGGRQQTRSFQEVIEAYDDQWRWMVKNVEGTYIVPMLSGWDRRPWGGSPDPLHDNSVSNPDQFQKHLESARSLMLSAPAKTQKMGIICCWNEFGEGSYIEPTKKYGFSYLERVKKVFGTK